MRTTAQLHRWFKNHRRRIAEVGTGMTLYAAFNWVFNNPLYFGVIEVLGMWVGGCVMFTLSLIQNIGLLFLYEKLKIDWVGVESLNDFRRPQNRARKRLERLALWAITEKQTRFGKLKKVVRFAALSCFVDPFVISVHYRRSQFTGVTSHDIWIMTTAVVIGNVYWTLRTGVLLAAAKTVWGWL